MLTTGEVAKLLHISSQTVINWLDQRKLPFERIAKGPRRISETAVLNFIYDNGISEDSLNQEVYQKIKENIPKSNVVHVEPLIVLNEDLKIISWNTGAQKLYGVSETEILGKPIDSIRTIVENTAANLDFLIRSPWRGDFLELKVKQYHNSKIFKNHLIISSFVSFKGKSYVVSIKEISES